MILAAGLSPAWQQIVVLDALRTGEVNRAREVQWCASGKVLNVGMALQCLCVAPAVRSRGGGVAESKRDRGAEGQRGTGAEGQSVRTSSSGGGCRTLALIGGSIGEAIVRQFEAAGVPARWVRSPTPTRVCTTILDRAGGTTTELVQNAGDIAQSELNEFRRAYSEEAMQAEIVILTGSLPAGAPATLYRELLEQTRGRAIVDAQGELLLEALAARPYIVKPNREELGRTLGREVDTESDLRDATREVIDRGAQWVVVSEGKRRLTIASKTVYASIQPPEVELVNPIGSGDCLAGGIAVALAAGYDVPDAARYGVAAAAENVRHLLPSRLDPAAVATLFEAVCVTDGAANGCE